MHLEIHPGVWLDSERALFLREFRTLVVADLHWGYARSHRARGNLVPLWGDAEIDERLRGLLKTYEPQRLVWLGDSLHTLAGRQQAEEFIGSVSPDLELHILSGNHDRAWKRVTGETLRLGDFFLHHGDKLVMRPRGAVELVGHHHPAVTWRDGAGLYLKLPGLVQGPKRWILPAFSPWAEGTDWTRELKTKEVLWSISPKRIFPWKQNLRQEG